MEIKIEDPFNDNVQDMKENSISKCCCNLKVEGGVIAVDVYAIYMSSPQPISKLSKPPKYLFFITYWLFFNYSTLTFWCR
jgi:hypothetical protein